MLTIAMARCVLTETMERDQLRAERHGEWQEQPDYSEPPLAINGDAQKFDFREDDHDYYSQPGNLFRMFSPEEKQRLFENPARALGPASKEVRDRHVANCTTR